MDPLLCLLDQCKARYKKTYSFLHSIIKIINTLSSLYDVTDNLCELKILIDIAQHEPSSTVKGI